MPPEPLVTGRAKPTVLISPGHPHSVPGDGALIVDGDNVPPETLPVLLAHMQKDGPVPHRQIFRNWRSTKDSKNWDEASKRLAFERVDRYKTTEGKNGSDIAVAVAAMDLLHAGVRRFCIASGDTDFASLVERLRRGGSHVTIVGHKMEGGLLAEIADEYMDWKSLMPGGVHKPAARRSGRQPRGPAAIPERQPSALPSRAPRHEPRGRAPRSSPPARTSSPPRGPLSRRGSQPPRSPAPPHTAHTPHAAPGRQGDRPKSAPAPRPVRSPAARPAQRPAPRGQPDVSAALRTLLLDAYEVARTDGEVDAAGWVAVDRLGQIARSVDRDFSPQKYGIGGRTSLSRVFERMPEFSVETVGRGGNRQYRVKRVS